MSSDCRHKASISLRSGVAIFGLALLIWGCGSKKPVDPAGNQTPALGNQPPVLSRVTATPSVLNLGNSAVLTASATDPDGDPLTFFWNPQLGSVSGDGAQVEFSSQNCCLGTIRVFLEVQDQRGGKTESFVDISIQP